MKLQRLGLLWIAVVRAKDDRRKLRANQESQHSHPLGSLPWQENPAKVNGSRNVYLPSEVGSRSDAPAFGRHSDVERRRRFAADASMPKNDSPPVQDNAGRLKRRPASVLHTTAFADYTTFNKVPVPLQQPVGDRGIYREVGGCKPAGGAPSGRS
jgi:hypothetical protein